MSFSAYTSAITELCVCIPIESHLSLDFESVPLQLLVLSVAAGCGIICAILITDAWASLRITVQLAVTV